MQILDSAQSQITYVWSRSNIALVATDERGCSYNRSTFMADEPGTD